MKRARPVAALAGLLASAVLAAPAAAFTAPELFVRTQRWDTHEETGPWLALASAPSLSYLGGYEIGYRLQASDEPNELQRVALAITGAPDGTPTQPRATEPYCVTRTGTPGAIVAAGPELQFEGGGRYTVKVSLGAGSGGATDCLSGPATTGSFSVDVRVGAERAGEPLSFRARPLPGDPFVGVRATSAPAGGEADMRCALDATVAADGSVSGSAVAPDDLSYAHPSLPEEAFTRPGIWTCVARGVAAGQDADFEDVLFGTPWSQPLVVEVRSDFRRRTGALVRGRSKRPRFTFAAEWPDAAAGGAARLTLYRVAGCKGSAFALRKRAAYRGRFDAQNMRVRVRRPRARGFYLGKLTFSGTHFLRAGVDPNPLLLAIVHRRLAYVQPPAFPHCP